MKTKAQHTPGPWSANYVLPDVWVENEDEIEIAYMGSQTNFETAKSNARLIAAAPRLLEVVNGAYEVICKLRQTARISGDEESEHYMTLCLEELRAAIDKAENK